MQAYICTPEFTEASRLARTPQPSKEALFPPDKFTATKVYNKDNSFPSDGPNNLVQQRFYYHYGVCGHVRVRGRALCFYADFLWVSKLAQVTNLADFYWPSNL